MECEHEPNFQKTKRGWVGPNLGAEDPDLCYTSYRRNFHPRFNIAYAEFQSPLLGTKSFDVDEDLVHVEHEVDFPEPIDALCTAKDFADFRNGLWETIKILPVDPSRLQLDRVYSEIYPVEKSWKYFLVPNVLKNRLFELFRQTGQELKKILDRLDPTREAHGQ